MELIFIKSGQGIKCPNKYYLVDNETIAIEVTNKQGQVFYSFIDKEDFDKVSFCNWKIRKDCNTFYLCNSNHSFIHRIITNCPDDLTVDHIDGNGLNNRKNNLRNVTNVVNSLNKRHSKMIFYDEVEHRYRVYWKENGKQKSKSFSIKKYGKSALKNAIEFKEYICEHVYHRPKLHETVQND